MFTYKVDGVSQSIELTELVNRMWNVMYRDERKKINFIQGNEVMCITPHMTRSLLESPNMTVVVNEKEDCFDIWRE